MSGGDLVIFPGVRIERFERFDRIEPEVDRVAIEVFERGERLSRTIWAPEDAAGLAMKDVLAGRTVTLTPPGKGDKA